MSDMIVKATIEGLQEDIDEITREINAQIPRALQQVGSEMRDNLQEHIRTDWYEAWGAPKKYKRRTDFGGGVPLGDEQNMEIYVKKNSLDFGYYPTGDHAEKFWDDRDGNALIEVIQENAGWSFTPDKDKKGRTIMPRPFWDNFVDEQESVVADNFIAAMNRKDIVKETQDQLIDMTDSKNLRVEPSEAYGSPIETDDDDLPY